MEDAVSIHPSFCKQNSKISARTHFFGVFDEHGCSHVAMKCKDRLQEIVRAEVENRSKEESGDIEWKQTMELSFDRMDKEVQEWTENSKVSNCRCELQTPQCDAVGSTAVVTPDKIIVSNCGDSCVVLGRNGVAVPLSSDHKPDRPDELDRIEAAGGRVVYWDGPRVLGILAMSRAIGDNYLKPFVISEPEVTVVERTGEEECLILASDGLWDVVSNDTACDVVRTCFRAQKSSCSPSLLGSEVAAGGESFDKACSDTSILLRAKKKDQIDVIMKLFVLVVVKVCLAFHPLDGILQAMPHVVTLFLVPTHFTTHIVLLFLEAILTANIHDCIHGKLWPVIGADYHTIHHTTYRHNYGHYTIWMDWMHKTFCDRSDNASRKLM